MKKKIDLFWYWFIFVVAFVLCFFAINDKKVGAYSLDSNGNVVSDNLYPNIYTECGYSYLTSCVVRDNNIYIDIEALSPNGYSIITKNIRGLLDTGVEYTFSIFTENDSDTFRFGLFNSNNTTYTTDISKRITYTFTTNEPLYLGVYTSNSSLRYRIIGIMITRGNDVISYEPYGIWYSSSNAQSMFQGKLPNFTSSLTYVNSDDNTSHTLNDVNSYIDNSYGYLYFDRLWDYLDNLTGSSYDNAYVSISFIDNLNINTSYIINSNKTNFGSGVKFYQDNSLMLDVRNLYNNSFCSPYSNYSCTLNLNELVNVGSSNLSYSYLNKIEVWSASSDERTLSFGYNNIGYNEGYNVGYSQGLEYGRQENGSIKFNEGYRVGYNNGYEKGVTMVADSNNSLVGMVGAIMTAPVNMLKTIFDFEFLGINLTNFLFSLISLFIVIWLIKIFL